jgi:hypothetical protein
LDKTFWDNLFLMRQENPKALKGISPEHRLPQPKDGQLFIPIPTSNLLGYRGAEEVFNAVVATKPQTFDGQPVRPLSQLEMRPRKDQLLPENGSSLETFTNLSAARKSIVNATPEKKAS